MNTHLKQGRLRCLARRLWEQRVLVLMALPFLVWMIIFNYLPLGGWIMAFENYKPRLGMLGSPWVGLKYFSEFLQDKRFYEVLRNTFCMGVLLDLHFIDGMSFDPLLPENPLFLPENQQRFISIWDEVSARLQHHGNGLCYELLNEVTDGTGYGWNRMYPLGVEAIRKREPERVIYVGSNRQNDVNRLAELHLLDDPHLVYNFHYYDPHAFTHQCAPFDQDMAVFRHTYDYPCFFGDELYSYVREHPEYVARCPGILLTRNDREDMKRRLRPASEFIRCTGKPLYCGEFGVISVADESAAARWIADLVDTFRQLHIGYAYWCYKVRDFGLVDIHSHVLKPELAKTLFG